MEMPAMAPSDSSFVLQCRLVSVDWEVGPVTVTVAGVVDIPSVEVRSGGGNVEIPLLMSQLTAESGIWPPRATLVLQWGKLVEVLWAMSRRLEAGSGGMRTTTCTLWRSRSHSLAPLRSS